MALSRPRPNADRRESRADEGRRALKEDRAAAPEPSLVVEESRRDRPRTAEEMPRLGAKIDPGMPVAAAEDGTSLQPDSLAREFVRIPAQARAPPKIRFHGLRHIYPTPLLAEGAHSKIAQKRPSAIGITPDLDSRAMPGGCRRRDRQG